ncbi:MAG: FAD-dependent oxidoreductase [Kiritimatiellae bacterium]|nr:FAD-dependent oxidoreductase [Kiritimatiellia bacterium]
MVVNRREFLNAASLAAIAGAAGGCATEGGSGATARVPPVAPWLEADVVVAGGGPAGVCAAVSAARLGVKTILAERFGCLGGNLTLGHVSPILGKVCPGTMADEVRRLLNANHLDAQKVMTRNGPEEHIDHEEAKGILAKLCAEAGVTVLLCAPVVDAQMDGRRVVGLTVDTPKGLRSIRAKVVVDATGDGRVAVAAGAEVKIGRESDGATQPSTLEFVVDGVDESCAITAWGGTDPVKLPSGEEYRALCKRMNAAGELPKNVTIVRLHRTFYPGERSVNATQINGIDPLDPVALGKAEAELRWQIDQCVAFLRKHVPGFGKCRVKSSAGTLGVRETRRVMGDAMVVDDDLHDGRHYLDAIVHNAWFLIDIHNPKGGGQAEGHSHPAKPYDIRYGAFLPKGIDGLLTAGRCISGTHRAHASYRVMTPCMAMGEAVGVAAALAVRRNAVPRDVPADGIRKVLMERGVQLAT